MQTIESAQAQSHAVIYRVNPEGRVTFVNPAWSEFARDNHGEAVMPERIVGCSLLDAITGTTVRELYRGLITRARAGHPARFHYRCDAPHKRRVFEMNVHRLADGDVEFVSTLLHEEERPPVALLETGQPRDERMLRICSWCQKVEMPDKQWLPVEAAIEIMPLMKADRFPTLTHGICASCLAKFGTSLGLD